jgi:endonuclease/exonuclease/phosphatase family metal-dependent hydrolase
MKTTLIILNILALIVLLLSCAAVYIDPNWFWQLSFVGFAFPVVLVVNVLFLFIWIIWRQRFGLIPLIAIALTWKFIHSTFAFNFFQDHGPSGPPFRGLGAGSIKLMTWNVKIFDLYNWSHNTETRHKMMELIKKEKPDVLCMQEFYTNNRDFHNVEFIRDTLGYKYFYFPPAVEITQGPRNQMQKLLWHGGSVNHEWGVATFSKFPILDTGIVDFGKTLSNGCIYTDISMNDKTVRVYNVHFQSIHLGTEDYAALDSLEETKTTSWTGVKGIMRKMKSAYTKRAIQADDVARSMNDDPGAKIICGDFNDVPVSYTYNTVSKNMQDAFIEKSSGFGATFANKFSIFRIDYTLFDPSIKINSYKTLHRELSDHYPVVVSFSL